MSARMNAGRRGALLAACLGSTFLLTAQSAHGQAAASAYTSGVRYDLAGRVVGTIAPDPDGAGAIKYAAVRTTYDGKGFVSLIEKGELAAWQAETVAPASWTGFTVYQKVQYTTDSLGRKLSELTSGFDPATSTWMQYSLTQFNYDEKSQVKCTAIRMNPATFSSLSTDACSLATTGSQGPDWISKNLYDAAGQLVQVRRAVGTSLEQAYATYSYTPNGKQEYVVDANGNRAKLEYDGFDRQIKWIFPSQTALSAGAITSFNAASTPAAALAAAGSVNASDYEHYDYDANDNRTSLRKRDGSTLTYQFDALKRITVKTVPSRANLPATYARSVYYGYDARGLMTSARFDSASGEGLTTVYDNFGRIRSNTINMNAQSRALGYCYDSDGNRLRMAWPDGSATNTNGVCSGTWTQYVSFAYDELDRPLTITGQASNWTKTFAYNARGERVSDTNAASAGMATYTRDGIGHITSIVRDIAGGTALDNTTAFSGYNAAGQILQETRSNDAYAFTGRTSLNRAFVANGLNQYASVAGIAHCYDANGNLTADGTYVYLYDIENRLVESHDQGAGNSNCAALSYAGTLRASLRYDPMGRLYETSDGAAGITRFLIDGDALVAEYNSAGTLLRRYVHGADGQADDPIAWYEGSAMTNTGLRYLYANQQGSIVLAADSGGGSQSLFKFDEYGTPQMVSGISGCTAISPACGGRFLYTGQALVPELGMYYYKARIYSPVLGRFMQTDPIGYKDQTNLYAYVANDPVDRVDPSGLEDIVVTGHRPPPPPPPPPPLVAPPTSQTPNLSRPQSPPQKSAPTVDTRDRTKELIERLKELRKQIQNCPGAASSPQCARLWKEYMAVINSPEITIIRKEASDLQWKLWGYAFTIEAAGLGGGPIGMTGAGGSSLWDYTKGKAQDWLGGF